MKENRSTPYPRFGGPRERERCLREAERYLQTADAEDAVQEALLRAWRKTDAWAHPDGPLPFLLAITRNEAFRLRGRLQGGHRGTLLHAEESGRIEREKTPLDARGDCDPELDRTPLRVDLDRLLGELPDEDRALLELHYREDLKLRVIANQLDMPVGTVKRRLHELRAHLRSILEREER